MDVCEQVTDIGRHGRDASLFLVTNGDFDLVKFMLVQWHEADVSRRLINSNLLDQNEHRCFNRPLSMTSGRSVVLFKLDS
jgi:hypothetical protein